MVQAVLSQAPEIATRSEPWLQLAAVPYDRPDLFRSVFDWELCMRAIDSVGAASENRKALSDAVHGCLDIIYGSQTRPAETRLFLDKTPRYYLVLDELYARYPSARFLLLFRNLPSVLSSIRKTWFSDCKAWELDFHAVDLIEGPRLMSAFSNRHRRSQNVMTLDYESILEDPAGEMRMVFDWLGVSFREAYLTYNNKIDFSGEFGDSVGVLRGKLEPIRLEHGLRYAAEFPSLGWANLAAGLEYHHQSSGTARGPNPYWEPGKATGMFRRYYRRYQISGGTRLPYFRDLLWLVFSRLFDGWDSIRR